MQEAELEKLHADIDSTQSATITNQITTSETISAGVVAVAAFALIAWQGVKTNNRANAAEARALAAETRTAEQHTRDLRFAPQEDKVREMKNKNDLEEQEVRRLQLALEKEELRAKLEAKAQPQNEHTEQTTSRVSNTADQEEKKNERAKTAASTSPPKVSPTNIFQPAGANANKANSGKNNNASAPSHSK